MKSLSSLEEKIAHMAVNGRSNPRIAGAVGVHRTTVWRVLQRPHVRRYADRLHDEADLEAIHKAAAGLWLLLLTQGKAPGRTKRSKRRLPKGWALPAW